MIATIDDHELVGQRLVGRCRRARSRARRQLGSTASRPPWTPGATGCRPCGIRSAGTDHVWQEISLGEAGRILLCETRLARSDPAGAGRAGQDRARRRAARLADVGTRDADARLDLPGDAVDARQRRERGIRSRCAVRPAQAEAHRRGCGGDLPRPLGRVRPREGRTAAGRSRRGAHHRAERRRALLGRAHHRRRTGRVSSSGRRPRSPRRTSTTRWAGRAVPNRATTRRPC